MDTITRFEGEYRFLSNFYPSSIWENGINYPTNEHFFQASKTNNRIEKVLVAGASSPARAKQYGRTMVTLREDWEIVKEKIMYEGLKKKFLIPELRTLLLTTGDAYLEEGNTWCDNHFGVCSCEKCQAQGNIGQNKLGILLMKLRSEIRERETQKDREPQ